MERLKELRWVVEVHEQTGGGGWYWEPIAAFNADLVAESYARECHQSSVMGRAYRVVEMPTAEPRAVQTLLLPRKARRFENFVAVGTLDGELDV